MRATGLIYPVAIILVLLANGAAADLDFAVNLKQRNFVPETIQKQGLSQKSAQLQNKHILVQFDRPLTDADKQSLAADGMELISYIPNFAYTVRLGIEVDESFINKHGLRWLGQIYPDDKISPFITDYGIGDWARRGGNLVEYKILLHDDENLDFWANEFERQYDAQIVGLARALVL